MTRLLGFEGTMNGALVSYGAAALAVDDKHVRNAVSGVVVEIEPHTFDSATKFKTPLDLDADLETAPLVVLAVDRSSTLTEPLVPDTGRLGGYVATKREKPYWFYVFESRQAFAQYCEEATWNVTDALLDGEVQDDDIQPLIRACLVLAPKDPVLWAMRVHWSPDQDVSRKSAERLLSPEARLVMSAYLRALAQPDDVEYVIKYDRGIANTGGLDLKMAIHQLDALHGLHEKLVPELRKRLPFLGDEGEIPEPRFQTLVAASARLGFGIRGETLRQRVIRYFELDLIAEVVAGKLPTGLAADREFRAELETLLSPPDTVVQHQPIGASELEPIERDPVAQPSETVVRDETVRVLGFVEGILRRVRRTELRVATNFVITVSMEDDGYGNVPVGVDILKSGHGGMFQPAVFSLIRRLYSSGRATWFLQRMLIVGDGIRCALDGFPSNVIDKALFKTAERTVSLHGRTLSIEELGGVHVIGEGHQSATSWLVALQSLAAPYELSAAGSTETKWLPPTPIPAATALRRIIHVLGVLGRTARIGELVWGVNEKYGTRVRINNTMRELRAHNEFFEIDEDEVQLSEAGRRWYLAFAGYARADDRSMPLFAREESP